MDQADQVMQEGQADHWRKLLKWKDPPPPNRKRPQLNQQVEEAKAEAKAEERRTSRRLSKNPQTVGRIVRSDIRIRRLSKILKIG